MEESNNLPKEEIVDQRGLISKKLIDENIDNDSMGEDHLGVEILSVKPSNLYITISKLKSFGFNYLQCQGGYDEGPGKCLVSFYHLISLGDIKDIKKNNGSQS